MTATAEVPDTLLAGLAASPDASLNHDTERKAPTSNTLLRNAGGRAPAGEPSRSTLWPTPVDARWQIEAAPDEHTEMR